MNLTVEFPCSPAVTLGGLVHAARMADKARAKKEGTLGEYIYPCPLDKKVLQFLNVGEQEFLDRAVRLDEAEFERWIERLVQNRDKQEILEFNTAFMNTGPEDEEGHAKFKKILNSIDPSRTDVTTWPGLIDLEEGRQP